MPVTDRKTAETDSHAAARNTDLAGNRRPEVEQGGRTRLKQECKELQQRIDEALKEAERPQSEVPEEENTVRAA